MKKTALRFLVTLLALCIALGSLTGAALAVPIYGEQGDSYIRSKPSLSGKQLCLFPEGAIGEYMNQSSVDNRGVTWYKISYGGKTGWVSSRYVTLSGETVGTQNGSYKPVRATGGDTNIRSKPSLSGKQLGLLPEGASAKYLGSSANDDRGVTWYYISYNGTKGWVSSRYTAFSNGSSSSGSSGSKSSSSKSSSSKSSGSSSSSSGSYDGPDTIWGDGDCNIRSKPSLSGKQVGLLRQEQSARFLGKGSLDDRGVLWYYISHGGVKGWVSSKYASFAGSGYAGSNYYGGNGTVYATGGSSYIRSCPSRAGEELGSLPEGASARYLDDHAEDNRGVTWYLISYKGKYGWVSSKYTYLR